MTKTAVENKWEIKKIKEVGRVVTGKTPPTRIKEYFGKKFPFITPTDIIGNSRFIDHPARYLSDKGYKYQRNLAIPSNTVCFTCIGSTVGKMAMTNRSSFTNQQINSIIVDSNIADYRYIFYLLKTEVEKIKNYAGGAAKPIVSKSIFEEISIPCPPLPIQHKIASILSAYDDLIELNERRIKILEEMTRLIYKEWFVKFRFPGYKKVNPVRNTKQSFQDSKISNGVKMVKSDLGMIPEGWEVRRLSDFIDFIKGSEPGSKNYYEEKQADSIRFIRVGDLLNLSKNFIYIDKFLAKTEIEENDVLISLDGTVGKVDYGMRGAIASGIRKCSSKIGKMYQHQLLKSPQLQGFLTGVSSGGTVLAHAGNHIKNYLVATSKDLYLEVKYSELCDPLFEQCVNLKRQNIILRQTRDMLLPKLISGKIDVANLGIKTR